MNITTIFVTEPNSNLALHQMSFADPYSEVTQQKMIDHTVRMMEAIYKRMGIVEFRLNFSGVEELWDAIAELFETTGWTLYVIDSEVV